MAARRNWHDDVFFGLHYDLHAQGTDTDLGAECSAEHLCERLAKVAPDWVQCDCKGHAGWTSWPTRVGSTSPGVVRDQVADYREATRRLGIPLGMHYSGVWDTRAVELHPEWACVNPDGTRSDRLTCPLSDYDRELLIPQMLELIDTYAVDGFWVDGENWAARACWCERCRAEFGRRTGLTAAPEQAGDEHWATWLAFHRDLFVEHVTRYADAVHARRPDCLICSNWMYTVRQPEPLKAPVDYLSGDYSWAWGAERAAVEGRLLDGRGLSWDLMAWGFTKTRGMGQDPPWVFKPAVHLCQEVAEVVALGGAVMVYGKPQRTGWLVDWHQDTLAAVAAFCRERQEPCWRSETVPQAAVLHLADHYYAHNSPLFNYGPAVHPVEGALHALLETQRSTDVLTEDAALQRLERYPLVVVPEQTRLSAALRGRLTAYLEGGGRVLATGAHLAADESALVGCEQVAPELPPRRAGAWGATHLAAPDGVVALGGRWPEVRALDGTAVWAEHLREQDPDKDRTPLPAVTARPVGQGLLVAVHGPLFENYFAGHYPLLRQVVAGLVDRLAVPWQVEVAGPAWLEVVLRQKGGRLLVNLLNRGAGETLSPSRSIIVALPPVHDVTVRVRLASPPQNVTLLPGGEPVAASWADGWLTAHVPVVPIHEILAVSPG